MRRGLLALILGGLILLSEPDGVRTPVGNNNETIETKTVIEPVYRIRIEKSEFYSIDLVDLLSEKGDKEEFKKILKNKEDYNFSLECYSERVCIPLGKIEDYKLIFVKPEKEIVLPPTTKEMQIYKKEVYQTLPVYIRDLDNGGIEYRIETPEGVQTEIINNK